MCAFWQKITAIYNYYSSRRSSLGYFCLLLEICAFFSKQPSSAGTTNGSSSELSHFEIPYIYFGIFDGHAGSATAVTAANELHQVEIELLLVVLITALDFK